MTSKSPFPFTFPRKMVFRSRRRGGLILSRDSSIFSFRKAIFCMTWCLVPRKTSVCVFCLQGFNPLPQKSSQGATFLRKHNALAKGSPRNDISGFLLLPFSAPLKTNYDIKGQNMQEHAVFPKFFSSVVSLFFQGGNFT